MSVGLNFFICMFIVPFMYEFLLVFMVLLCEPKVHNIILIHSLL